MNQRILIVDDDKDHAESIADLLQLRDYDVKVAHSGEQAIELFGRFDFDVTVMDVKLPGMNGVEAFFQFRKLRPSAQVIMMTGLSVEQLIARAVEGGVVSILRKPFAMGDLIDALAQVPRGLVLVADDDPTFAEATSDFLTANGYRTAIARNGQEAFAQVISNRVDCLLLDLCMPILSGMEVYWKLRESACSVPTIIVSAFAHEVPEWLAAEQILIKPFDPTLLIKAIKRILERCRVEAA